MSRGTVERYIARQPIFDERKKVYAYELLYRSGATVNAADFSDGNRATRNLLSDAITVFGLPKLTNSKLAFINFTEDLILDDFVMLAKPNEVVVEILEDTKVTPKLLLKLENLKDQGYILALDDYVGEERFEPILPLVDIIKVDFRLTDVEMQGKIIRERKNSRTTFLAEKVETVEDFSRAQQMGYTLFQGYFFEKPTIMNKKASAVSTSSQVRLLRELAQNEISMARCANIIRADATLTYQLLQKVRTVRYYRGNSVKVIQQALVILGEDEVRRWAALLLARGQNVTCSDELVRAAYLRGIFTERIMERSPWANRSGDGFLMGMFSLLDKILGISMERIVKELPIAPDVNNALLTKEQNIFSRILEFILIYEMKNAALILPDLGLEIDEHEVVDLYMECIIEADRAFSN